MDFARIMAFRFSIQTAEWQVQRNAFGMCGGIVADAQNLAKAIEPPDVSADAKVPQTPLKALWNDKRQLLRSLGMVRMQVRHCPVNALQILPGKVGADVDVSRDEGDPVNHRGVAPDEDTFDFVLHEALKDLLKLRHTVRCRLFAA